MDAFFSFDWFGLAGSESDDSGTAFTTNLALDAITAGHILLLEISDFIAAVFASWFNCEFEFFSEIISATWTGSIWTLDLSDCFLLVSSTKRLDLVFSLKFWEAVGLSDWLRVSFRENLFVCSVGVCWGCSLTFSEFIRLIASGELFEVSSTGLMWIK